MKYEGSTLKERTQPGAASESLASAPGSRFPRCCSDLPFSSSQASSQDIIPLQRREATVRAEADEREKSLPRMAVMRVTRASNANELKLPGTMQPDHRSSDPCSRRRISEKRLADIGDHVKAGQVLAEIDAPELDQQIRQAEATVEQAQAAVEQAQANLEQGKANRDLAQITADRWKALATRGVAPQQDSDQYQAQLAAQNANVQALDKAISAQRSNVTAAKANLARLQEIQNYRIGTRLHSTGSSRCGM